MSHPDCPGQPFLPFLSVQGLSKQFAPKKGAPVVALDGVSLATAKGETTAIVGPDGAGKSTLLRCIAGLLVPDRGEVTIAGEKALSQAIGYMPQKFGLYEDLTVRENMDLHADLQTLPHGDRPERFARLLEMAGLARFESRLAGKLSGGMKQKLGLICTLLNPPQVLLLDEPSVGVDPLSRRELWEIVTQLTGDRGMTVLVSTSGLDEAARCDNVILLFEGKVLASGTPERLKEKCAMRTWLATPPPGTNVRTLQATLLDAPGMVDALPQGGEIRLVCAQPDLIAEDGVRDAHLGRILEGATLRRVDASLEDSVMLLLNAEKAPQAEVDTAPPPKGYSPAGAEEMTGPVIKTEHLFRFFGDFAAVNDVSFSVNRGEVFGLLGPNGAGKTTTFRMLCGLLPPSRGKLYVAGVDVARASAEARRHIGYVAQKFSLYGPLSVMENLAFFAGAQGLRGERKQARIDAMIREFSLEDHLDMPAQNLPGGWKQRLAMAVGLLHEPSILFLDEATSGADPIARRQFWKRIGKLADSGVTVIVTTHFMEEAEYCDRILIQDSGKMLAMGSPAAIRARAATHLASPTMEDAFIAIVNDARKGRKEQA